MNKYGFIRVAAAVPEVRVADVEFNTDEIIRLFNAACENNAYAVVFPELCITGYSCQDLFLTDTLIQGAYNGLKRIADASAGKSAVAVVGMPVSDGIHLYNCAVVVQNGKILGAVPKTYLPNYSEFYEQRWFYGAENIKNDSVNILGHDVPFGTDIIFKTPDFTFAAEVCEDMWAPCSPAQRHAVNGAEVIFNCSASNDVIGKDAYRVSLVKTASFKYHCTYVFTSAGFGESTTDTLFCGHSVIAENGSVIANKTADGFEGEIFYADTDIGRIRSDRRKITSFYGDDFSQYTFVECDENMSCPQKLERKISKLPFVPAKGTKRDERMEKIFMIQARSLAKRLKHIGCTHPVVGISGGLDSTLALLVTAKAMDILGLKRDGIVAVTMPGFGTTGRTYNNAVELIHRLGASFKEISIKDACLQHFKDIGHDTKTLDVTYENSQARERTQILMDVANKCGGIVIGTGDLSEMALGWSTYAGDHISMYCVNCGVPKSLVRHLVAWINTSIDDEKTNTVLDDILDTPISPELLPADENGKIAQKTEEILGDYNIHDFILYYFLRFGFTPEKILFLAKNAFEGEFSEQQLKKCIEVFFKRFFNNQFKRSCIPDGPKIGSVTLSPRADFRMSSDSCFNLWLEGV